MSQLAESDQMGNSTQAPIERTPKPTPVHGPSSKEHESKPDPKKGIPKPSSDSGPISKEPQSTQGPAARETKELLDAKALDCDFFGGKLLSKWTDNDCQNQHCPKVIIAFGGVAAGKTTARKLLDKYCDERGTKGTFNAMDVNLDELTMQTVEFGTAAKTENRSDKLAALNTKIRGKLRDRRAPKILTSLAFNYGMHISWETCVAARLRRFGGETRGGSFGTGKSDELSDDIYQKIMCGKNNYTVALYFVEVRWKKNISDWHLNYKIASRRAKTEKRIIDESAVEKTSKDRAHQFIGILKEMQQHTYLKSNLDVHIFTRWITDAAKLESTQFRHIHLPAKKWSTDPSIHGWNWQTQTEADAIAMIDRWVESPPTKTRCCICFQ